MQDPAYEAIGDYRFSKWKTEPKPEELPRFSTGFFQVTILVVVAILVSARLALDQTLGGNFLPAKIWIYTFMGIIYLGPILLLPVVKWRRRLKVTPPEPPAQFPSHAIYVRIKLKSQSGVRGYSHGWLWVDGEWLRFSGESFDFKLRPSDFKMRGDIVKALLRGWAYVVTPKGISPSVTYISPCREIDGKPFTTPDAWSRLQPALDAWTRAPRSLDPPLYPPLRGNVAPFDLKLTGKVIVVVTALSTLLGLGVAVLLGAYLPGQPIMTAVVTGGMGLLMASSLLLQNLNVKFFDKEVDKAQAA